MVSLSHAYVETLFKHRPTRPLNYSTWHAYSRLIKSEHQRHTTTHTRWMNEWLLCDAMVSSSSMQNFPPPARKPSSCAGRFCTGNNLIHMTVDQLAVCFALFLRPPNKFNVKRTHLSFPSIPEQLSETGIFHFHAECVDSCKRTRDDSHSSEYWNNFLHDLTSTLEPCYWQSNMVRDSPNIGRCYCKTRQCFATADGGR